MFLATAKTLITSFFSDTTYTLTQTGHYFHKQSQPTGVAPMAVDFFVAPLFAKLLEALEGPEAGQGHMSLLAGPGALTAGVIVEWS